MAQAARQVIAPVERLWIKEEKYEFCDNDQIHSWTHKYWLILWHEQVTTFT